MKKYHFTSHQNAKRILLRGIYPQLMPDYHIEVVRKVAPKFEGYGIWLWDRKLRGRDELGAVLWQTWSKKTFKVYQLEVRVDPEHLLRTAEGRVVLYHYQDTAITGSKDAPLRLHHRLPASIGVHSIPSMNVRVVKVYDLLAMMRGVMPYSAKRKELEAVDDTRRSKGSPE